MAISRSTTWSAGDVLTAAAQNGEFNNIIDNALALVSPWTGNMNANANSLTSLNELAFNDSAANATAARRLRANAANLTWHDGTVIGRLFYAGGTDVPVADGGTGLSSGTSGGILGYTATGTIASSALLTNNALVIGGGAGATPTTIAALTSGQLAIGSTGAAPVPSTLTAGSNITITNAAGAITIAAAAGVSAATQAEMETASSTTVYASPGRVQFHPGVAKAWGMWNNAGVIDISYNLSSITDNGVGNHTVNFTTAFSTANYSAQLSTSRGGAVTTGLDTNAVGSIVAKGYDGDTPFAAADLTAWRFVAYGDQ